MNFLLSVKTSQMNIFLDRISWVLQYLSYNVNSLHFWGSSSEFTSIKNNQKNMYDRRQRFNPFLWRYNWYILHLTYARQISSNLTKIKILSSTNKSYCHFCEQQESYDNSLCLYMPYFYQNFPYISKKSQIEENSQIYGRCDILKFL